VGFRAKDSFLGANPTAENWGGPTGEEIFAIS